MKLLFLAPLPSSIVELLIYSDYSSVLVSTLSQEKKFFRYDLVAVTVVIGRPFRNIASLPSNPCEGAMRYVPAIIRKGGPACLVKNDLVDYFLDS